MGFNGSCESVVDMVARITEGLRWFITKICWTGVGPKEFIEVSRDEGDLRECQIRGRGYVNS